ncbi:MAG TPA: hypothetical protein VKV95_00505 [Terriglobia bacterium]|nr:hypothetical protein [Terriglobia bacterium]
MSIICVLGASIASGKVLVRWNHSTIPPARALGLNDLVVSLNGNAAQLLGSAPKLGYRIFYEAGLAQAPAAAEAAVRLGLAGVVIDVQESERGNAAQVLQNLRASYPNLILLALISGGIEPQIRGRRHHQNDGGVQVTSPTHQPWIDSNLASIRIGRAFAPAQAPLYSFKWDLSDLLRMKQGPSAADYSLAVAEAGAFHADVILDLPGSLQGALAQNNANAWSKWKRVKRYLEFWPQAKQGSLESLASVGIVMDNPDENYEAVNLIARHNIPFRIIRSADLTAHSLDTFDLAVFFAPPQKEQIGIIDDFASQGGTAILVGMHGSFPWQSTPGVRSGEHSATYAVGKGSVIELSGPVTDPEIFARDVRRSMDQQRMLMTLWNSLTTVAALYLDPQAGETILELVNYYKEPVGIQVQVKGTFSSIRYETPEEGCCKSLTPVQHDGFTEFEVPQLVIGGRVHLRPVPGGAPR